MLAVAKSDGTLAFTVLDHDIYLIIWAEVRQPLHPRPQRTVDIDFKCTVYQALGQQIGLGQFNSAELSRRQRRCRFCFLTTTAECTDNNYQQKQSYEYNPQIPHSTSSLVAVCPLQIRMAGLGASENGLSSLSF